MTNLNYGIIGNCKSAALVSEKGSIDWFCLPNFSSSSVFAKLLDKEKGGEFEIKTTSSYLIEQSYIEDTNILITRFSKKERGFDIIDFMPRYKSGIDYYISPPELIRIIGNIKGTPEIIVHYNPRLGYAQYETVTVLEEGFIKSHTIKGRYESVYLYSNLPLKSILEEKTILLHHDAFLLLSYNQKITDLTMKKICLEYERTKVYWLNWSMKTINFLSYASAVSRSSLVLKLLTFQKTGAIIAAVTTSIPESIGEGRNWDYRYCWIRDGAMIVSTLYKLGHRNSARRFMDFILSVVPYKDEEIQIIYGINGEKKLYERELGWLSGYEGSKPVRIGNKAYVQKQHDIFGVLLDIIHTYLLFFRHNTYHAEELWTIVRSLVRSVISDWKKPDRGIWEFRKRKAHIVFSKVLCWVALDRGIKISHLIGNNRYINEWNTFREKIKEDICQKGWNNRIKAFTQSYGGTDVDASNLLMGIYGFLRPDDERYIQTVYEIKKRLYRNGLMYRYSNNDDFGTPPASSFTLCSFWMIKSMYLIGEKKEAKKMFDKLLAYSNHLGLFSEDIDVKTKKLLGNFPQGYSHLALIDTAMTLAGMEMNDDEEIVQTLMEEKKGSVF